MSRRRRRRSEEDEEAPALDRNASPKRSFCHHAQYRCGFTGPLCFNHSLLLTRLETKSALLRQRGDGVSVHRRGEA